ncbi:MAG: hypothetical protein ACFFCS_14270 [Candidatus Hodarchaeota archaeon]
MKLEIITIVYMMKKLYHYKESKIDEIQLSDKGGPAVKEGLQYINDYCTNNGYKVLNAAREGNMYTVFIVKE